MSACDSRTRPFHSLDSRVYLSAGLAKSWTLADVWCYWAAGGEVEFSVRDPRSRWRRCPQPRCERCPMVTLYATVYCTFHHKPLLLVELPSYKYTTTSRLLLVDSAMLCRELLQQETSPITRTEIRIQLNLNDQ